MSYHPPPYGYAYTYLHTHTHAHYLVNIITSTIAMTTTTSTSTTIILSLSECICISNHTTKIHCSRHHHFLLPIIITGTTVTLLPNKQQDYETFKTTSNKDTEKFKLMACPVGLYIYSLLVDVFKFNPQTTKIKFGSTIFGKILVRHWDGSKSWKSIKSGAILGLDPGIAGEGHAVSAKNPTAK